MSSVKVSSLLLGIVLLIAFALRVFWLNSVPVSLNLDEAINGLDALQLFQYGRWTPFLQNNFGRETLFFYFQGLVLQFVGINLFILRWPSVLLAIVTVPLLHVTGRRLFGSTWVGLLAAAGLAVSYWHLYFSRMALRGIFLLPLLLAGVWCFWRGWYPDGRSGRGRLWLAAAGLLFGLSLYTYLAARLIPLLLALFVMINLFTTRARRPRLVGALVLGLTFTAVALPLLFYFWQQPQALNSRIQAVSVWSANSPGRLMAQNALNLLFLHGGVGRWLGRWPALNVVTAAGFFIGLVVSLARIRRPVSQFLLLWWALGLLPVLLSVQSWQGETTILRGVVAWPAIFLIAALGLNHLNGWLRRAGRHVQPVYLLLLLLAVGLATTGYNYFEARSARITEPPSDHPPYLARQLNQAAQPVLLPLELYTETVTNLLLRQRYPRLADGANVTIPADAVYYLANGSRTPAGFVLLQPEQGTAYLLPPLSPEQRDQLRDFSQDAVPVTAVLDSEQEPIAQVYHLPPGAPFISAASPAASPVMADFAGQIRLVNIRIEPPVAQAGDTVTLHLTWQALGPVDGNVDMFIHLFDVASRQRWSQVNRPLTGLLFDANRWPVGLMVPDIWQFQLPPDGPPGAYRFEIGLYDPLSGERLPVAGGEPLVTGKLYQEPFPVATPQTSLDGVQFGREIALTGFDLAASPAVLNVVLFWQALDQPAQDYTVFNHLLDPAGKIIAQYDSYPQQGQYPTSWWSPGEVVQDSYQLPLPENLPAGAYTLRLGLYEAQTGQRLPRSGAEPTDYFDLPVSLTP